MKRSGMRPAGTVTLRGCDDLALRLGYARWLMHLARGLAGRGLDKYSKRFTARYWLHDGQVRGISAPSRVARRHTRCEGEPRRGHSPPVCPRIESGGWG
jgi:hypothetical protein